MEHSYQASIKAIRNNQILNMVLYVSYIIMAFIFALLSILILLNKTWFSGLSVIIAIVGSWFSICFLVIIYLFFKTANVFKHLLLEGKPRE